MKHFKNWSAAAVVLFAVACGKTETTTHTLQTPDGSKKIEVEYSYKEKPQFVAKMKSELAEVNDEIKKLSEKIASSSEKAKEDAQPKLDRLKEKAKNLDGYVAKTEDATESTWDEVKSGSKKALEDVKEGFNDARAWVAEKIAPK
jgi:predicted  nucleic acid-binding Zn-ribbon protein